MIKLGLIIPYDYKLLSVAAIIDVFETVNRIYIENNHNTPFKIEMFGLPGQIKKEGGFFHGYPVRPPESDIKVNIVLLPSFTTADMKNTIYKNQDIIPWIQQQFKNGAEVASFCTGAFLFAATGLLNGKSATTHVDACSAFALANPSIMVKADQTVTSDERCYTSGGSTSSFQLLVLLVQKYCGIEIAIRIAKIFSIDMDRYKQSYFRTFRPNYTHSDDLVKKIQERIETKYTEINTLEEITKELPASRRNILRRFKLVTGIPPIEYLQHVRVETAKKQLEETNNSISEIIFDTGYSDPKFFRKVFLKYTGMTPVEYRNKFRVR